MWRRVGGVAARGVRWAHVANTAGAATTINRFYKEVPPAARRKAEEDARAAHSPHAQAAVVEVDGGYAIELDGRRLRTPAGKPQVLVDEQLVRPRHSARILRLRSSGILPVPRHTALRWNGPAAAAAGQVGAAGTGLTRARAVVGREAQKETLATSDMHLTGLINTVRARRPRGGRPLPPPPTPDRGAQAVDNPTNATAMARSAELIEFFKTDTVLCVRQAGAWAAPCRRRRRRSFRDDSLDALHEVQKAAWDPPAEWFRARFGVAVPVTTGLDAAEPSPDELQRLTA